MAQPRRPHRASSPHHGANASRLQRVLVNRIVLGVLYLAALSLLVAWEYRERFESLSSDCSLESQTARSPLFARPYAAFLDWASSETAHQVSVVAIPADVEEAQSSLCVGRSYMADLLRTLAALHPAEIVVDKFYGPTACAAEPEHTTELLNTVHALHVPIVLGESTGPAPENKAGVCLQQKPQLDFGSPNVHHALTRLNAEREKLPLTWRVLPERSAAAPHPEENSDFVREDSLAWAAVKLYDPAYAGRGKLQALLRSERHPWTNLNVDLPHSTSTAVLCTAGSAQARQRWQAQCTPDMRAPDVLGKVIVIGSERSEDMRTVLDTRRWGFDLHALYIEALLSGTFLRALPFAAAFVLFALFVFIVEGVPTLLQLLRPRWKRKRFLCHAYKKRRYFWMIFWTITIIVVSTVVCLGLRYLPPLIVYGDMALVAISKLLIFTAESTEHPLLHTPRKVHTTT